MKQLYSLGELSTTNGSHGSLTRNRAPAVVAVSSGLQNDELQEALSTLAASMGSFNHNTFEHQLPVRLSLLNTSRGRLLTHISPAGENRILAHSVLDVPQSADAQLAIQTWGSPVWQRTPPESQLTLPDLPYLPVADHLNEKALSSWLAAEENQSLLQFVLNALFCTPANKRIVLAASSYDMALLVYAVTRVVPTSHLEDFTFSTFESDPLSCQARVVGHEPESPTTELPRGCYQDGNVAYNPRTGQRSVLATEYSVTQFIIEALKNNTLEPVDRLRQTWQRLGVTRPDQLDLVYRVSHDATDIQRDEVSSLLTNPTLCSWLVEHPQVVDQLVSWAIEDREFALNSFSRIVQPLRQRRDQIHKLSEAITQRGLNHLQLGDLEQTATALEVVLPMIAPSRATAIWGELIAKQSTAQELTWETRKFLLPRFVRFKQHSGDTGIDPNLASWLDVNLEQFEEVLSLDLPASYQLVAGWGCLQRDGEPSPELARILGRKPRFTLSLLQPDSDGLFADRSVKLFELLLTEASDYPWLEEVLKQSERYPAELLVRFFECSVARGQIDADRLIRGHASKLIELYHDQPALDRLAQIWLTTPPADLFRSHSLSAFIDSLQSNKHASADVVERIHAIEQTASYLKSPSLESESLQSLSSALQITPAVVPVSIKEEIFQEVVDQVIRNSDQPDFFTQFEKLLLIHGNTLASDTTDLYENLLRAVRKRTEIAKKPNLLRAFLAMSLGATASDELNAKLDGLEPQAFSLASEAARSGGARLLKKIDADTARWPKSARTQWTFLQEAVRPQGLSRSMRDMAFLFAGAVSTAVGVVVWQLLR